MKLSIIFLYVRRTITKSTWAEIHTAYASGIGLREIARNMSISEGTVLARASREQWTPRIQAAKSMAKSVESEIIPTCDAAALTMQERAARHVQGMDRTRQTANRRPATRLQKMESNPRLDCSTHIFGSAPLMDGHEAAQERVSNPTLSWIRILAVAVEAEGKLKASMTASELVELCQVRGLEILGVKNADDDQAKRQIGMLMKRAFKGGDEIEVDGYTVRRGQREYCKPSGDRASTPEYSFHKSNQTTQPP